ncbi:hypothetical protein CL653_00470 [bacterium]|nr:hypothetical protein [bacterium]|tara:strand:- start:262 stop:657 length:396 start_codon:yes stop_codon:yes gene_type:complete
MDGLDIPTKFDLGYAESNVCFSITDCSLKKYSFWCLNKQQAETLLKRLKHIEKLTWSQFINLSRQDGVTPEKNDTPNFIMIHEENTSPDKMVEQYYFHFRIEKRGLFRVFGYQKKQFFCITHIDPNGKINH